MKRLLKSLAGPIALALVVLVFGAPSAPGAALVPGVGGAAHAYYLGLSHYGCNSGYVGSFGMFDPSLAGTYSTGGASQISQCAPAAWWPGGPFSYSF